MRNLLLLFALLAAPGASSAPAPISDARVAFADSKQHLREDWVKAASAKQAAAPLVLSLRGGAPSQHDDSSAADHKLLFCIKQRNLERMEHMLGEISDPESKMYREFLTFDEVGSLASDPDATAAVVAWLEANGATVHSVTPRGEFVTTSAPLALWEKLLAANFTLLEHAATGKTIARCQDYSLPSAVAAHVHSVAFTSQLPPRLPRDRLRSSGSRQLSGPHALQAPQVRTTTPELLAKYYRIESGLGATGGSQSVFESLGQSYSPADLKQFAGKHGFAAPNIRDVGGHQSDADCANSPGDCGEANLDVQYMAGIAPSVPTTFWYVDQSSDSLYYDYLVQVAADKHPVLVHSISYGSLERELETSVLESFETELIKLGLLGVTVVVASGDDGVAGNQARSDKQSCGYNPSYPASSPHVTAVGATQGIEVPGAAEVACASDTGGLITTGGGFSVHYPQPAWQAAAVADYLEGAQQATNTSKPKAGFDAGNRGYPDVAMAGHNYELVVGGRTLVESGTSASAPVFAAMVSLVNSALLEAGQPPVGFLNPTLYHKSFRAVFNAVTQGRNNCAAGPAQGDVCCDEGFEAAAGWDPLVGWGSVDYAKFKAALLGGSAGNQTDVGGGSGGDSGPMFL